MWLGAIDVLPLLEFFIHRPCSFLLASAIKVARKNKDGVVLKYFYDNGCDNIFTLDLEPGDKDAPGEVTVGVTVLSAAGHDVCAVHICLNVVPDVRRLLGATTRRSGKA